MDNQDIVYITGHKNPDTDSICSSLSYANLKRAQGIDAVASRAGELNPETEFALNYFGVEKQQLLTDVHTAENDGKRVQLILVDHNENMQAVDGIEDAHILEIIDHHRLGGMQTAEPLFVRIMPVGCTSTIIGSMYFEQKVDIPKKFAGLMLSAIISDTVLFKSPTCTDLDKEIAQKLAKIAGVDLHEYGIDLLKAGSNVDDMTAEEIVKNDLKEFQLSGHKIIVSQTSVMDSAAILQRKDEILKSMRQICKKENYDMSLIMITNIIEEATNLLFFGEPTEMVQDAFNKDTADNMIFLPGVMSRKKQIIPQLTQAAKKYPKD